MPTDIDRSRFCCSSLYEALREFQDWRLLQVKFGMLMLVRYRLMLTRSVKTLYEALYLIGLLPNELSAILSQASFTNEPNETNLQISFRLRFLVPFSNPSWHLWSSGPTSSLCVLAAATTCAFALPSKFFLRLSATTVCVRWPTASLLHGFVHHDIVCSYTMDCLVEEVRVLARWEMV